MLLGSALHTLSFRAVLLTSVVEHPRTSQDIRMRSTTILMVMVHMLPASLVLKSMGLRHFAISSASKLWDEVVSWVLYTMYVIMSNQIVFQDALDSDLFIRLSGT